MREHLHHSEPSEVKELNFYYLGMDEKLVRELSAGSAKERQSLDRAAALLLQVNRVEIDLADHRRPSDILSALIEKGMQIDSPEPSGKETV